MKHLPGTCFTTKNISIQVSQDGRECFVDPRNIEAELTATSSPAECLTILPPSSSSHIDPVDCGTEEKSEELRRSPDSSGLCSIVIPSTPDATKDAEGSKMTQAKAETAGGGANGAGVGAMDTRRALLCLVAIFLVSLSALTFVYKNFPHLEEDEYQHMKLPRDIEDAKSLGRVLSHYKERYFSEVLAGVFVTYIFLQTFAVPGSIFLSILSGFLFRWELALLLICFCSATGASFCYLLSYLAGRPIVLKYLPERTKSWQEKVDKQRDNLLFYIIFLRITPFLPNWFINITSPIINVPLWPFWFGTFIGVAPPSILAVQAGTTLYQLTSSSDAFSLTSVVLLALAAILSLVPIILKNRLREKFD
ncbi:transmembrane protein 41B-like [Portunus trituberculatus]|uniref:transmembrane protein 41B-like n=1 Tax=Portunus trituberculatus TaxID=210409 RepID=UPI001E1D016E|nr:transmembrane protein 41B-like [Portunus trituberculatus]